MVLKNLSFNTRRRKDLLKKIYGLDTLYTIVEKWV